MRFRLCRFDDSRGGKPSELNLSMKGLMAWEKRKGKSSPPREKRKERRGFTSVLDKKGRVAKKGAVFAA